MRESREHLSATLYREHFARLVRAVALMGVSDPEDVVVEAFIRLLETHSRIRDPRAAAGYLRRTAMNLALNRLRSGRSEQAAFRKHGMAEEVQLPDHDHNLADVLLNLPVRARQVVVMRYWLDMQDGEIAAHLGIEPASVRTHLSAARKRLRQQLLNLENLP